MYLEYGERELAHLKSRDKRLGEAIERIGPIQRAVDADLFSSVVHHIIGQQISTAAQATIWQRMRDSLGQVNVSTVQALDVAQLQRFGITFKKAEYIWEFTRRVASGELDLESLHHMSDQEVIQVLSGLNGIGVWTAEMIMTFCMQRPDVVSFGDLAILRGMRMLYRHRKITREQFEKYRRRYSPYGTVASLYLWAIAGGALPELQDPAPKKKVVKK